MCFVLITDCCLKVLSSTELEEKLQAVNIKFLFSPKGMVFGK